MEYVANNGSCYSKQQTKLQIYPLPNISIALIPSPYDYRYCETEGDVKLYGSPTGGVWTSSFGGAFQGFIFKPSAVDSAHLDQRNTITYTYKHPITGCDSSKSVSVIVYHAPQLKMFTKTLDTCQMDTNKFLLTATLSNMSKVNWQHNLYPPHVGFKNQIDRNNESTILLYVKPNKESVTKINIEAFTESAYACPWSYDTMSLKIDTNDCFKNPLSTQNVHSSIPDDLMPYPNPSHDNFKIELKQAGAYAIKVYSMVGELLIEKDFEKFKSKTIEHDLTTGNYLLLIQNENGNMIRKKFTVE